MSLRADGINRCDRCGKDVGNGGIFLAASMSDLNPDNNFTARKLHWCREPREDAPRGCVGLVLTEDAMTNYLEVHG